jgi:hypothetical protein
MMMLIIILIILFAAIIIFDFLPVIKIQSKRDSFIYCALLSIAFSILLLFTLGIKITGLFEHIKDFFAVFTGRLE